MNIDWINLFITPLLAAIFGFVVWFIQSRINELQRAKEALHDDRRRIYSEVLEPFIRFFAMTKSPHEVQKAIQQINSYEYKKSAFEFGLIGPDNAVRAFNEMMQFMYHAFEDDASTDPKTLLHHWGAFLLELRKSLGDRKTTLYEKDMLSGFIKF